MSRRFPPAGSGPLVLVLHGPNLGALGRRDPSQYGTTDLTGIMRGLTGLAAELGVSVEGLQSDSEGELVAEVLGAGPRGVAAIVCNPGALAHTSYALRDAVDACGIPVIEVHLSNVHARERWRHHLAVAPVAAGVIAGLGTESYQLGLRAAAARARPPDAGRPDAGRPDAGAGRGGAGGGRMSEAATLYERYLTDLWRDDAPVERLAAELVTPGFVVHQARTDGTQSEARSGPEALAALVAESLALFSDVEVTVEAGPVTDGTMIAARWRFTGSYRGGGIPGATAEPGTPVAFSGHDLFRIQDGRLAEYWTSSDGLHLMAQLGLGG